MSISSIEKRNFCEKSLNLSKNGERKDEANTAKTKNSQYAESRTFCALFNLV